MNTLPLAELLPKLTPLPWPLTGPVRPNYEPPTVADTLYSRHAANVLPELVAALQTVAEAYFPGADDTAATKGEQALHSSVQSTRAALAKATAITVAAPKSQFVTPNS